MDNGDRPTAVLSRTRTGPSHPTRRERMLTRMSEPHTDNEQRPVAPGIAAAMRNVRNAAMLSQHPRRHRWNLPSDREARSEPAGDDER